MASAASSNPVAAQVVPGIFARQLLYVLLGFSAGLPFYMFSTVLSLRLQAHEVGLVVIGFFAWVQLLPTFKFLWAPRLRQFSQPRHQRPRPIGTSSSPVRASFATVIRRRPRAPC